MGIPSLLLFCCLALVCTTQFACPDKQYYNS